jgi:3-methyladenine DNA glycosylase AlkD
MAEFAVHNKKADNKEFLQFFPIMEREARDDRNFVKKAVSWALRQIGKRNKTLHQMAIATAKRIAQQDNKPAKWIAKNALDELEKRFND